MRASSCGVLWCQAPAQRLPHGTSSVGNMASAGAAAAPDRMADAGNSGVQHPPAGWQTQAAPGQAVPGSSAPSPESDDEKDGPEPVEYSPGGRYGRMDLVLGRGAFKTVRQVSVRMMPELRCISCSAFTSLDCGRYCSTSRRYVGVCRLRLWLAGAAPIWPDDAQL